MTIRGKFIAIEGIDGSGKRTQLDLLVRALTARGHSVYSTGFPQYSSWFGKMVGQFLNGDLGDIDSVDPHFAALLYAGNRFESKTSLNAALNAGQIVIADRYIASNLAHQTARAPAAIREDFLAWIAHLEYDIYGLPLEDLVLYLRVPPTQAQALVAKKSTRTYTTAKQDILEASLRHLEQAAEMYDRLARRPNWVTVECFNAANDTLRTPEAISADVLAAVDPLLTSIATASSSKGSR